MIAAIVLAAALAGRFEFREIHMAVEVRVVVHAESEDVARAAARTALDRVRAWDDALSDWRDGTPAQRLPCTRNASAGVEGRLAAALDVSWRLGQSTDGGFDAGLGALTRLWREARHRRLLPDEARIEAARASSGRSAWRWDPATSTFTALHDGVRMDFGAIAQGLAADDALAALREAGLSRSLVDVSGDIAIGAPPPGESGWRIAVEPGCTGQVSETLLLHDCAISTSGDRLQSVAIEGTPVGHLLDPATGRPLTDLRQATVIARDAATADAMATALCTLPIERATAVAERHALAARIDRTSGAVATGGWSALRRASSCQAGAPAEPEAPRPSPATPASGPPGSPARPSR